MENIAHVIATLTKNYQIENWWPHETNFEIIIGAILVQRTKWANVEKALSNLKNSSLTDPASINEAPIDSIEKDIRATGFFRLKSKRLKDLSHIIMESFDGDEKAFLEQGMDEAKEMLLSIKGIGLETAETILLYAGNYPLFISDTYAKRIFSRIGIFNGLRDKDVQKHFIGTYGQNPMPYKDLHSAIVIHCQNVCKKKPECSKCPIEKYCKKCNL